MIKLPKLGGLLIRYFVLSISLTAMCQVTSQQAIAQCSLIDKSRDALFITYEQMTKLKIDDRKIQEGVLLRLYNNSTCSVLITTGSAEKFLRPLPENPTVIQRIKREVDYDLPDDVLVPDIQYRYVTSRENGTSVGGDNFYGFRLLGKHSLLFEVPLKHFDLSLASKIILTFHYAWEKENRAMNNYQSVENTVQFWAGELPKTVKANISKR